MSELPLVPTMVASAGSFFVVCTLFRISDEGGLLIVFAQQPR